MERMLKQDLQSIVSHAKSLDYIMFHYTDLLGILRGRTIPAKKLDHAISFGTGLDGSSIPGLTNIDKSDIVLKPDLTTFTTFPRFFYSRNVGSFICDVYEPNGNRLKKSPRAICHESAKKLRGQGYEPLIAAELEFHLVRKGEDGEIHSVEEHVTDHRRYFDVSPDRDLTGIFRMDLVDALSHMGLEVERFNHEAGSAQSEVTIKYSSPLRTSDNVVRQKFAARTIAHKKYGWIATFMPKPWFGRAGSGMHIHIGLICKRWKGNTFFDPSGDADISQTCRYFIGGLLQHARALCAITAPTINSYKRLVLGYEAPIHVVWGKRNRSALVRVPNYFPGNEDETRVELRCPDPTCNPYLACAVVLEAGLDGIRSKIEPGDPLETNVYRLTAAELRDLGITSLPSSLKEALEEWKSDDICIKALGREVAEEFMQLKMEECEEYESSGHKKEDAPTQWEVERYLFS